MLTLQPHAPWYVKSGEDHFFFKRQESISDFLWLQHGLMRGGSENRDGGPGTGLSDWQVDREAGPGLGRPRMTRHPDAHGGISLASPVGIQVREQCGRGSGGPVCMHHRLLPCSRWGVSQPPRLLV